MRVELLCVDMGALLRQVRARRVPRSRRRRRRVRRLLGCWADVGGRGGGGAIEKAVSVARRRIVFVVFRRRGVTQEKGYAGQFSVVCGL